MRTYLFAFVLAAVVGAILTPFMKRWATAVGAVSVPGGRHVHEAAIPRLGGVAIAVATCVPLLALFFIDSSVALAVRQRPLLAVGALGGGVVLCVLGIMDDTKGMRALHKLLVQVGVAVVVFALGFRIETVGVPFVGSVSMGIFALPVTVVWIVGITNAVNLIDGLDGLAAGVAFFAGVTNFVVASINDGVFVAVFMAAMMGALIGFLFYNFNPARIFMGDSGSYFLGFVLATTSLTGYSQKTSTAVALLVPIVALGVPIVDTLFSMLRRFLERRPLFSADRGHIHHRLLDMGLTHRRAVLILYGVCVFLAAVAIAISLGRSWEVGIALFSATVILLGLVRFVGGFNSLQLRRRAALGSYDPVTEQLRRGLPEMLAKILGAESPSTLLDGCAELGRRHGLAWLELESESGELLTGWRHDDAGRGVVSLRLPVGDESVARSWLSIGLMTDGEQGTSSHVQLLLRMLVDTLANVLTRQRSAWAPAPRSVAQGSAAPDNAPDGAPAEAPRTLPAE